MPRRKKRVYSTKPRTKKKPVTIPPIAEPINSQQDMNRIVDEVSDALTDDSPSELLTMDEAIEEFRKNPRQEQFWCPEHKGFALAAGNMYLEFKDHFLLTSDPAEVEALLRANDPGARYNVHFFSMSPELRNFRKPKK